MALAKPRLIVCSLLLGSACINEDEKGSPLTPHQAPETSDFSADTAREWLDLVTLAVDTEGLNPPEASRIIGYAGVTLYEAVVAGMPAHRSLGFQLNGLGELPEPPNGDIHWPSAANAALAEVLAHLLATASMPTLDGIAAKEAALATQFAAEATQAEIERGIQHGEDVAAAIVDWIAGDGYAELDDCAYTVPSGDGLWQPTGMVLDPLEPCWGDLRPFVLLFGAECAPLPHPAFSLAPTSAFAGEAREVYELNDAMDISDNLTSEEQAIATFWADGAGSLTPPGHWVSITGQVLAQEDEDLDLAAEAYARVGIGVADAFISCWKVKYVYNLLRPISYIQDPAGPIADATWSSFIGTPPFPEFTSGHSTQSGAVAELLTDLLGVVAFTDETHSTAPVPLPARSFTSFAHAAEEAAISRLYGGIHFRSAIERGLEQGACIGRTILMEVQFRE